MFKKIKNKARDLKLQLPVLLIAYKDKRTPVFAKLLLGLTIGYLLSPIDLIPDFIPVLGLLDDVLIVPLLITASVKMIPEEVKTDSKFYVENHPEFVKKSNWFFGVLFIVIWLILLIILIKFIVKKY